MSVITWLQFHMFLGKSSRPLALPHLHAHALLPPSLTHNVPFWPPCICMHSPHAVFFWSHCTSIHTFCAFPCTCKNTYTSCLFLGNLEVSHAHTPCPLSLSLCACTHILTLCPSHQTALHKHPCTLSSLPKFTLHLTHPQFWISSNFLQHLCIIYLGFLPLSTLWPACLEL